MSSTDNIEVIGFNLKDFFYSSFPQPVWLLVIRLISGFGSYGQKAAFISVDFFPRQKK